MADLLHELLHVGGDRLEAQGPEDFPVQVAHLGADAEAAAILGRADRPHPVREVPEAVVPVAEKTTGGIVGDPLPRGLAVFAIERLEHGIAVLDDEGQLEELQVRRSLGKAHGGHVAERQLPALDHRHEIARGAAELEDAADQLEADAVAELALEQLAEARRGAVVNGRGLLVPTELDD